ncbi:MAG: hypothetical protein JXB49_03885 [Bacteroidales bacterium]|nr:hypothetical protein [Bacteroidales bacterium]
MKMIGGYFELELNHGKEYHEGGLRLNLARTSFEYILRAKGVTKVLIPYYTCEVMLEPIIRTGIDFEFYNIDENLEPVYDYSKLKASEYFLYTNYFGVKGNFTERLSGMITNLIIDNSQAFYEKPLPGIDTFYSPRKFFGIPDGGYLYTSKLLDEYLEIDDSSDRFGHLIGRIEKSAEEYYSIFQANDQKLSGQPLKEMSKVTRHLLQNINYEDIAHKRRENFEYLRENLAKHNSLDFDLTNGSVPLVYPYCTDTFNLRQKLIDKKIFVATYWSDVLKRVSETSVENRLVKGLIPLPIDQRYNYVDMQFLVESVLQHV